MNVKSNDWKKAKYKGASKTQTDELSSLRRQKNVQRSLVVTHATLREES